MDRQHFYFLKGTQVEGVNMNELPQHYKVGKVTEDSLVFNNLIKTKAELFSKWLVPIKDSWQWRFVG